MNAIKQAQIPAVTNGNKDTLFLGIDGGGSKCRAKILLPDGTSGFGMAGPANPMHSVEQTVTSILKSTQLALSGGGLSQTMMGQLVAGVGLAGVNLPDCYRAISEWRHPFKNLFVTTDLHIACLGAHQGEDGAVLIIGTGSSGFVSVNGWQLALGGHGFPHGDKGSGAWIGFEAYKRCLLALDGVGMRTTLTEELLIEFAACDAISLVEKIINAESRHFAKLAPLVFEAAGHGDIVAIEIIREGAAYLSALACRLMEHKPPRLSILGGLSQLMLPWLSHDIQSFISLPMEVPESGAIYFAQQSLGELQVVI